MTETANIDTADLRAKYGRAKYGSYSLWSHAEIEADITALCDALEQARGSFGTLWHEFEATSRRMVELTEDAHTIRAKVRAEVAEEIEAQLVCCDIAERIQAAVRTDSTEVTRLMERSSGYHAICHWGGAAAAIARGHAQIKSKEINRADVR